MILKLRLISYNLVLGSVIGRAIFVENIVKPWIWFGRVSAWWRTPWELRLRSTIDQTPVNRSNIILSHKWQMGLEQAHYSSCHILTANHGPTRLHDRLQIVQISLKISNIPIVMVREYIRIIDDCGEYVAHVNAIPAAKTSRYWLTQSIDVSSPRKHVR
jgi:hypothetical protein